jgi:two-component sensor histidine kinase
MLQVCRRVGSPADIDDLFSGSGLRSALAEASGVLVQLFWNRSDRAALDELGRAILGHAPGAILVGASSAGQVADGSLVREDAVAVVSCFDRASLEVIPIDVAAGAEASAGARAAEALRVLGDLKAVLVLASPSDIDAAAFLRAMQEPFPSLVVFGGGSVEGAGGASGILCGGRISERRAAVVALRGAGLRVEAIPLFDWLPLGPEVAITEAGHGCIRRIDGAAAVEYYRENLDIFDAGDMAFLEFPLLVERDGFVLARNTLAANVDGSVKIAADLFSGEKARIGYLDIAVQAENVDGAALALRRFRPEGILAYSCVCRLYTLEEDIESETLPFQAIAPTAGMFTSGEFCRLGSSARLLNSSEVLVALREGPPPASDPEAVSVPLRPDLPPLGRRARMTSHLFKFIGALTERIEKANRELVAKNAALAEGNEGLCAEVIERALAEQRAKAASAEKEMLLRELQHRVKNSLSLISSIASLEGMRSSSGEARAALEKLESRITALASLYDILYVSGDISEIELSEYIGRVVDYAAEGLGADAKGIAIRRDLESVRIDVKRAISLGLVVNELVTDSLKHAFEEGRGGRIDVSSRLEGGDLVVAVADDGVGLPPGFDAAAARGFGLVLVRSLAEQLGAEFSGRNEGGALFELRMPL